MATRVGHAAFEAAAEPAGVQRLAVLAGEYQVPIRPGWAEGEPLGGLSGVVGAG